MNLEQCHQCGGKIKSAYLIKASMTDILSFCSRECISDFESEIFFYAERIRKLEEKEKPA